MIWCWEKIWCFRCSEIETYAYYLYLHLDKVFQGQQKVTVSHNNSSTTSKFVSEPQCNADALQDILDYINPTFTPQYAFLRECTKESSLSLTAHSVK